LHVESEEHSAIFVKITATNSDDIKVICIDYKISDIPKIILDYLKIHQISYHTDKK